MKVKKKVKSVKKHAFGVLLYRKDAVSGAISVFLVQENSPRYWAEERTKIWGLPKGRGDETETAFESASREFYEEVGCALPNVKFKKLMEHHRPNARRKITVFVGNATGHELAYVSSNVQTREWPRKSGNIVTYPEIFDAQWIPLDIAIRVVLPGQKKILKKFAKKQARKQKNR